MSFCTNSGLEQDKYEFCTNSGLEQGKYEFLCQLTFTGSVISTSHLIFMGVCFLIYTTKTVLPSS